MLDRFCGETDAAFRKVIAERGKAVFDTHCGEGASIVDNKNIIVLGKDGIFNGNHSMQINNRVTQ